MKLSIGISVFNGWEDLKKCLQSIFDHPPSCSFEVVVVDDASTEDISIWVRQQFPQVKLVTKKINEGLASGINSAIDHSEGEFFFRLDADTQVLPESLDKLVRFLELHSEVGVVGPKLVFPDGSFQKSCSLSWPGPFFVWREFYFVFDKLCRKLESFLKSKQLSIKPLRVAHLIGASLLVRREAIESAGKMDPQIAFFRDETDWQKRISDHGWQIFYLPEAVIVHKGGSSAGDRYIFAKERNLQSLWRFNHKHYGSWEKTLFFYFGIISGSLGNWLIGWIIFPGGYFFPRLKKISRKLRISFGFVLKWHFCHFREIFNLSISEK